MTSHPVSVGFGDEDCMISQYFRLRDESYIANTNKSTTAHLPNFSIQTNLQCSEAIKLKMT